MNKQQVAKLKNNFDWHLHLVDGFDIEFCYARELMNLLGYERWENFVNVIDKAKKFCENSKVEMSNHFRDVTKMVGIGSDTERSISDIMLTRYACYLVTQNGDSRKKERPINFDFNYGEFAIIESQAGLNNYRISRLPAQGKEYEGAW